MARAIHREKPLRLPRCFVETPAMAEGHGRVLTAVDDENRKPELGELREVIVTSANPARRYKRVGNARHIGNGGEGRLQDEPRGRDLPGELDRDGRTERFTEEDQTLRSDSRLV